MNKSIKESSIHRTSISLKRRHWDRLQDVRNKSKIINYALDLYFDKIEYMKEIENDRMKRDVDENFLASADKMNDLTYADGRDFTKYEMRKKYE